MATSFQEALGQVLKARFPLLYIQTHEEQRVVDQIVATASDPERFRTPRQIYAWSITEGLVGPDGSQRTGTTDAVKALESLLRIDEPFVAIFRDLHPFMGEGSRPAEAPVLRRLRDIAAAFKSGPVARALILVSPMLRIPAELEKDLSLLDFPLPREEEIRELLDDMVAANRESGRIQVDVDDIGRERLAQAALGLTVHEAENAFARAMVMGGRLSADDVDVILEEKRQTIRKSGLLEFVQLDVDLDDVGGLENLKRWLGKRANSWLAEAAAYGVPAPKGVLITGVPGCGKSLTAKAIAATWGLPLLRLDIGKVFAGLVGSSEENMRTAIRTAEALAPCVLWIDEIEKGFAGATSAGGDSGTSARVFGSFLTWMQEKSQPVFVIATANNIDRLPPEFLRKGRFDEIFFVDLPTSAERAPIWTLHLERRVRSLPQEDRLVVDRKLVNELAEASEGYSGAEIEQAVIAALFDAFAERRPVRAEDLRRAVQNMVPLSITQAEQIQAVRSWADVRAVAATAAEDRSDYPSLNKEPAPNGPEGDPLGAVARPMRDHGVPAGKGSRGGRAVDF